MVKYLNEYMNANEMFRII